MHVFDDGITASHFSHDHFTILLQMYKTHNRENTKPHKIILDGKVIPGTGSYLTYTEYVYSSSFFVLLLLYAVLLALQNIDQEKG